MEHNAKARIREAKSYTMERLRYGWRTRMITTRPNGQMDQVIKLRNNPTVYTLAELVQRRLDRTAMG